MKKVNLLFLCMIAFISCNEEQDLDLSVNQNDAGKEIVLKERDSRYPLILSQRKTKPRNTKSIPRSHPCGSSHKGGRWYRYSAGFPQ